MKHILSILSLCIGLLSVAQPTAPPKLVVGIVVDQMRQDYIWRYYHQFGEGGFKRLLDDGYQFGNAHYNYAPTTTGPGHASIYTGTTPSIHGIINNNWTDHANDFYDRYQDKNKYCVGDVLETAVGGSGKNGNISPRNLQTTTVTDELRMFTNDRSKVIAMSIKDRGAVLPGGHHPTGVYWYDSESADFISSTYYMNKLPDWVDEFNNQKLVEKYYQQSWNTLLPITEYSSSTNDESPYEKTLGTKNNTSFPYVLKDLAKNGNSIIRTTPFGNMLLTQLAIASVKGEELGKDGFTDFLAISYSSTDYAGHDFGPRSMEVHDMYLRLDLEIKNLLDLLDVQVGKGEYVVFLTSDHGVSDVPQQLADQGYPGGYYFDDSARIKLAKILNYRYGEGDWIQNISGGELFLNRTLITQSKLNLADIQQFIAEEIRSVDKVLMVATATDLAKGNATDPLLLKLQNGYNQRLSGDVLMIRNSGYMGDDYGKRGSSHGTVFTYDTHIPIIFYGKNIPTGKSVRQVSITDIASTLSMLLNISLPSANTGTPLIELFNE